MARNPSSSPRQTKKDARTTHRDSTEPLILVVEDEPSDSARLKAMLAMCVPHARVHFVLRGWEAKAYLARKSPHHDWERCPAPSLVILDLGLPDIKGIDILEWMAEWDWLARIPVIVFTGSEDAEQERRAYALGVRRYLRKPNDWSALAEAARAELGPIGTEPQKPSQVHQVTD